MNGTQWLFSAAVFLNAVILSRGSYKCPATNTDDDIIFFPHENNCKNFYECSWGKLVLLECPEGLHFNSQINKCDWPENSKCKGSFNYNRQIRSVTKNGECPLENPPVDILLPHESNCEQFYKCDRGEKVVQNCPEGLHFYPEAGYCDWPWNVECKVSVLTKQLHNLQTSENIIKYEKTNMSENSNITERGENVCPVEYNGEDVLLQHPTNCTKFLHCAHGQPVEKDCPAGLYFNFPTSRCDWPWNVECENSTFKSTTVYPDNYYTPEYEASCLLENLDADVLLPHESDCTKFYKCDWGQKILQSCPSGLHFNVTKNYCDWPEKSFCSYNRNFINGTSVCSSNYLSGDYFSPHEYDCQKFYICLDGKPNLFVCPPDLYFNPESNSCEELEDIACEINKPV